MKIGLRGALSNEVLKRNLVVLGVTSAASTFSISLWQGYLPPYLVTRLGDPVLVGLAFSAYSFVTVLAYVFAGWLGDNYGRKVVIVLNSFVLGLAPVLLMASDGTVLMLAPVLYYWAVTALKPNFNAMVTDDVQPSFRGRALGAFNSMAVSVSAVAFLLSGFQLSKGSVIARSSYDLPSMAPLFMYSAVIVLTIAVARLLFLTETYRPQGGRNDKLRTVLSGVLVPLRRRTLFLPTLAYMLHDAALSLVLFLVPIYADQVVGMPPWLLGAMFAVQTVLLFALQVPFGRIADKRGRTWTIIVSFLLEAVLVVVFILDPNPIYAFVMYALWIGMGQMDAPAQYALLADMTRIEERATVIGGFGAITTLVAIPAPLLGGYLYKGLVAAPFYLCSALLASSATIMIAYRVAFKRAGDADVLL